LACKPFLKEREEKSKKKGEGGNQLGQPGEGGVRRFRSPKRANGKKTGGVKGGGRWTLG